MFKPLLIIAIVLSATATASDFLWCDRHFHDPYSYITATANSSDSLVSPTELNDVIQQAFARVMCDTRINPADCSVCLTSEHIFNVLDIETSSTGLDEAQFAQASTIIVNFMLALEHHCSPSTIWNWNQTTYSDFTHAQMNYSCSHDHDHDHDHDHLLEDDHSCHTFTQLQLETAMTALNATYRPGEKVESGTPNDDSRHNISVVCSNADWPWFRSYDVFTSSHVINITHGATEDELGHLNLDLLARLLRGDCMTPDQTAVDGFPNEDDFVTSIFHTFGNSCIIDLEGFDTITHLLGIGGDHDHDHDHDHFQIQSASQPSTFDEHDHEHEPHGVAVKCYTPEELLTTFHIDPTAPVIRREDFERMSTALVQQAVEGCVTSTNTTATSTPPPSASSK